MRTIAILPVGAAALAAGAIVAWGLAGSRAPIFPSSTAASAPATAAPAIELRAPPRSTLAASLRYRAEACSGDYVCREDGAWEVVGR